MIGFIFIGIPLICIIAVIIMGCRGGSKSSGYKGTTVFLESDMEQRLYSFQKQQG